MKTKLCPALGLLLLTLCPRPVQAGDDWPQFRGPTGQGSSDATGLPITWSETENVAWKTPIPGQGWSSPTILGNQIWLTTAVDEGHSLHAVCIDRGSGRKVHDVEVFQVEKLPKIHATNSFASPTPVLEPGSVYVHFGTFGTACLDPKTGKIRWKNQELTLDHQVGPGSSPVLYHDLLLITCDGIDVQYAVAFDRARGESSGRLRAPARSKSRPARKRPLSRRW